MSGYYPGGDYYTGNSEAEERRIKAKQQRREIRFTGSLIGAAVLLFVLINNAFALFLSVTNLYNSYLRDPVIQFSLDIIVTFIAILLPFMLMGRLISKRVPVPSVVPLELPQGGAAFTAFAVFTGFGLCMLGNIITSWVVSLSQLAGHEFVSPDISFPEGTGGFVLSVVRIAVVAAICEELSFRGAVLQPLRKHGEWFAIICSACVFGLLHGNFVQAPFAIIAGIGLGWACIKTRSIWTPIAIHFLNNLFSVAMSYLLKAGVAEENEALVIESVILYTVLAAGAVSAYFFYKKAKSIPTRYAFPQYIGTGSKLAAFFLNVPMIIAIAYMLFAASKYIK